MAAYLKSALNSLRHIKFGIMTTAALFTAVLAVALAFVGITSLQTYNDTHAVDRQWQKLENGPSKKALLLSQLQNRIGYGGAIHKLNKYIENKDHERFTEVLSDLDRANQLIEEYHVLSNTLEEHKALNDISTALEEYQSAILRIERNLEAGSAQIASNAKFSISDGKAIKALATLIEKNKADQEQADRAILQNLKATEFCIYLVGLVTSVILIAAIALFLLFVETRIRRPLRNVVQAIKRSAETDVTKRIPERDRQDEIGQIARLLDIWRQSARGKAQLHKELERAVSMLNMQNEIATAANQAIDLNQALEKCVALVCQFTGWDVGHVWKPDDDGSEVMLPVDCWYVSDPTRFATFKEKTNRSYFQENEGLPGRIYKSKSVHWIDCVQTDQDFPRVRAAKECGILSGVGAPVIVDGEVALVIEFFSTKQVEETPELIEILNHVGTQIGRAVERDQWSSRTLEHSLQLQVMIDKATEELRQNAKDLEIALEKEQQLNALQREFVSMVSHEFRTPLAIIDSSAQKLLRRKTKLTEDDIEKRTGKIRTAVVGMTKLMESTLTAARVEAGKLEVEIGECNLRELIENVCEHQQEIKTSHRITIDMADDMPTIIRADHGAIEQVLTNLLSNAIKYSPDAPDISLEAMRDGDMIILKVADNGLGIDEDDVPKLFTRFFRAKTSTGISGTGLGLNLTKILIEEHGGSITVSSAKGQGTTFTVHLPVNGPTTSTEDNLFEMKEIA